MRRLEVIAGSGNADHPVLGDIDGDGIADFEIAIANTGRNVRIASDFIL